MSIWPLKVKILNLMLPYTRILEKKVSLWNTCMYMWTHRSRKGIDKYVIRLLYLISTFLKMLVIGLKVNCILT